MTPRPTLIKLPRLSEWRIRRGLVQRTLAQLAGTSRVNVARIEGGGETSPPTAMRLAQALDCTIDDLMGLPPKERSHES